MRSHGPILALALSVPAVPAEEKTTHAILARRIKEAVVAKMPRQHEDLSEWGKTVPLPSAVRFPRLRRTVISVNGRPSSPGRSCLNRAGLPSFALTNSVTTTMIGERMMSPAAAATTSTSRLIARGARLSEAGMTEHLFIHLAHVVLLFGDDTRFRTHSCGQAGLGHKADHRVI